MLATAFVIPRACAPAMIVGAWSVITANTITRRTMRWLVGALAMWSAALSQVRAQDGGRELPVNVFVGTEVENYLRYLQTLGITPLHPWSARMFSSEDLARLTPRSDAHPWASSAALHRRAVPLGPVRGEWAPLSADVWYNTSFPFGYNDGAVWQGRGATVALQGGASLIWGPWRLVGAPTVFWAQNGDFTLAPHDTSWGPYAAALFAGSIDRPQRFGSAPYGRVDPGQSSLRLGGFGLEAGVSAANRWWGPMSEFPYVVGNNAAGFPHAFFGTASPRDVWIGRVHASVLYGRLDQTEYSPVKTGSPFRLGSGAVVVYEPRFLPGLEVGAARFFHTPWPDSGGLTRDDFFHLFETFIKARITKILQPRPDNNQSADNQLASVFARWVLSRSGAEVYAEFGRGDHNWNARDLFVEPEHSSVIGFGFRKAFRVDGGVRAIRFETFNYEDGTLARHRGQSGAYVHGFTLQGHTQLGQLMGTGIASAGGAAALAAYEDFTTSGVTRWTWSRLVTLDRAPGLVPIEAQHVLAYDRSYARGRGVVRVGAAAIAAFGHNLSTSDITSLRVSLGWTRF